MKDASTALAELAKKIGFIAGIYLAKAAQIAHSALQGAWSGAKVVANQTAELSKTVGNALLVFSRFAGTQAVHLAQVVKKAALVAGIYLGKATVIAKAALHSSWVAAKSFGGKTMETVKLVASATFDVIKKFGNRSKSGSCCCKLFFKSRSFCWQNLF
jgi:hypothetical protein